MLGERIERRGEAMRLKVQDLGAGAHPSERVVKIETQNGPARLVVDAGSILGDMVEVGHPVAVKNGHYLVELPRETYSGDWRVWVARESVSEMV